MCPDDPLDGPMAFLLLKFAQEGRMKRGDDHAYVMMPEAATSDDLKRLRDMGDAIHRTFVYCGNCGVFTQVEHEGPFEGLTLPPCWRCKSTDWIQTDRTRGFVADGCNAPPVMMG